jgi:parallel beta-helix repeat protein
MTLLSRLSRSLLALILCSFLLILLRFSPSAVVADASALPGILYNGIDNGIDGNLVYAYQDGIAIFQSSNNNQMLYNWSEDSTAQGVHHNAHANRNLFKGNQILHSGLQGFYIKSGGDPPSANRNQAAQGYRLTDSKGQHYLSATQANAGGLWKFQFTQAQNSEQVSLLERDGQDKTSAFSGSAKRSVEPVFQIVQDGNQQKTIRVSGITAEVTVNKIKSALGSADADLLVELPAPDNKKVWLLNANLWLEIGVILNLAPAYGVDELRLRSQASTGNSASNGIDYSSFIYLRANNAVINIDNMKIFSWDPQANTYDTDPANGRAYLLAKFKSTMNIRNSEIGYLGSRDSESYGLSWRDVNDPSEPNKLRTRVTGEVLNSFIHHNYFGIYTYQASNMTFRGNEFYDNVEYGFDPHDFSHSFLVENNKAYNNGAHGFIISVGCHGFIFRNNKSYDNHNLSDKELAHGFMLDPGTGTDKVPSYNNILENNEAYGNEGYGLRILGSNNNQIRNNYFHSNEMGISVEQNSTGNVMSDNRLHSNSRFGLFIQETAAKNVAANNEVIGNGDHGIYIHSDENQIDSNSVESNLKAGIALLVKTVTPTNNIITGNRVISNSANGIDLRSAIGTLVQGNLAEQNKGDGVYLKDSTLTAVSENTLRNNTNYGIEVNGPNTTQNTWLRNAIYGNGLGVIVATGDAILSPAPQGLIVNGLMLTGIAAPGAAVEIFADPGSHAQYYVGHTTAGSDGSFTFVAPSWPAGNITAINANASPLSASVIAPVVVTPTPIPIVTPTPTLNVKVYIPVIQKP